MIVVCLDLEGVLIPEIWIALADRTGVAELRRTTRDEPDYDVLMRGRLKVLAEHKIGMSDIERTIAGLTPLPGAIEFLTWLRSEFPLVVLSDTFDGFARPLLPALGYPTLFCHQLEVENDRVTGYRLRMPDHKRAAVRAFAGLNFRTIAAGDSYNDTSMLGEADAGILFRAPENVVAQFPQFPLAVEYGELQQAIESAGVRIGQAPR